MKAWVGLLILSVVTTVATGGVAEKDLLEAQDDASTWLMYGKNYSGWRYSELSYVNASNVDRLVPQWIYQIGTDGGRRGIQTTPLVYDGLMFLTGPSNTSYAVDLLTGRGIWRQSSRVPRGVMSCCGEPNRGFAALGDKLFKVSFEATLLALDSKTGDVLWETVIDDFQKGYSATVAPLIVKNMVVVGIAGAEFGTRDFIDAYDATTGKRIWRFWTIPGPGEPGHETWGAGDAWKRGGGSSWITGTYDPELNLIYWGTGNPGPDMDGTVRPGDNLYTCAVVALDADTGEIKWHFQFTPHDVHDWDAISDPVLMDIVVEGRQVKALVQANRNGFFYVLDRTNGKFLLAKPYTEVTWADGIDSDGRPILIPGMDPTEDGTLVCPGMGGGHNWHATAYSPQTGLYYAPTTDGCQIYYMTEQGYVEGGWYQASTARSVPSNPARGAVVALEPATGETAWRYEMISRPTSGLLATAGGLVFSGDAEGYLTALDAHSGKPLWQFQTGGPIRAPPITYFFNGKQYIAVVASSSLITFALPEIGE